MTKQITLSRGLVAIVDDEDYERAMDGPKWFAAQKKRVTYAQRNIRRPDGVRTTIGLHSFLTGYPMVDHINGNGLDNRKENLRNATFCENASNRGPTHLSKSGYKGVSWHKHTKKWMACIKHEGVNMNLGYFDSPEAAALAYDVKALELRGPFAWLNTLKGNQTQRGIA